MQLLFYLVYYHSTCFGRGSRPSSGVIHKNCNGSHQCVSMRVGWSSPVSSGMCTLNLGTM